MQLPDAAIGSIVAAAIAGLVVFISTVLSKEQKTSEFRQVWIDELRKDIAQYISGAGEIAAFYNLKKNDEGEQLKFLEDNFELIHELQSVEHRIILRLNPKEHENLISKIRSYRKSMIEIHGRNQGSSELENNLTDALLRDAKEVLKNEWERVKRGEPAFRLVKWIAVVVLCVLGFFLLFSFLLSPPATPTKDQSNTKVLQSEQKVPEAPPPHGISQSVQVIIGKPSQDPKINFKKDASAGKAKHPCSQHAKQPNKAENCQIDSNIDSKIPQAS